MTLREVDNINELPEIEIVSDLISYLQTLPQHLPVVKANMEGIGYNRVIAITNPTCALQNANIPSKYVDFIDWDGKANGFEAVVL